MVTQGRYTCGEYSIACRTMCWPLAYLPSHSLLTFPFFCSALVCRGSNWQAIFPRLFCWNWPMRSVCQRHRKREGRVFPSYLGDHFLQQPYVLLDSSYHYKSPSWFQLPSGNPGHWALITSPPSLVPPAVANLLHDDFCFRDWTLTDKIIAEILLCWYAVLLGARDGWYLACASSE